MLYSNKSKKFNKKSHFKAFVYVSYDTYDFMIRYDSYDTHTVLYDSWALTICRYDTELFTHNTIRITYRIILTTMSTTTTTKIPSQPSIKKNIILFLFLFLYLLVNDCILMYLETMILNIHNFLILYGCLFGVFFFLSTPALLVWNPKSVTEQKFIDHSANML